MRTRQRLAAMGDSSWYWLALLLVGLSMEGVALLYQYLGDYEPCVLCIHVRIWLLGVMGVCVIALAARRYRYAAAAMHGLTALLMGGLLERSYQLLATERGWIFGSCDLDAGLPHWFALDRWFPAVLGVKTSCGYTPELLFGVTMAEALLLFSAAMIVVSVALALSTLLFPRHT